MGLEKKRKTALEGLKNVFLDGLFILALVPILFFVWLVLITGDIKREISKRF